MILIETKNGNIVSGKEQFFDIITTDGKRKVEKFVRKRTNLQNSYMHSLFTTIAKDVGEDMEYIKRHFKNQFLKRYSERKNIEYVGNTSKLTTIEFNEFVEKVLNQMGEFGYIYPTPDQYKAGVSFSS